MFVMLVLSVMDALSDQNLQTSLPEQSAPQVDIAYKVVQLKNSVTLAGSVFSKEPMTVQLA